MKIATRAGQDSDCNPSNALGILGVMQGYGQIPAKFTGGLEAIADEKFLFTQYSYNDIVKSSVDNAVALVELNGGESKEDVLYVARQEPVAAEYQAWPGNAKVAEQIFFDDERWHWEGKWQDDFRKIWRYEYKSRLSATKNATAYIDFQGSGASITGILLPDGGLADIYLDGEFVQTIDVYPDEANAKPKESLWHVFGLKPTKHRLKLVVKGEPYRESAGSNVSISSLIVYQ